MVSYSYVDVWSSPIRSVTGILNAIECVFSRIIVNIIFIKSWLPPRKLWCGEMLFTNPWSEFAFDACVRLVERVLRTDLWAMTFCQKGKYKRKCLGNCWTCIWCRNMTLCAESYGRVVRMTYIVLLSLLEQTNRTQLNNVWTPLQE